MCFVPLVVVHVFSRARRIEWQWSIRVHVDVGEVGLAVAMAMVTRCIGRRNSGIRNVPGCWELEIPVVFGWCLDTKWAVI